MTVVSPPSADENQPHDASVAEGVWSRLNDRIEDRLSRLELIVSFLFQRPLDQAEVDSACELASSVAASLGVLGLSAGADLIRRVADSLEVPDLGIQHAIAISSTLEDARIATASMVAEIQLQRFTGTPIAIVGEESELVDTLVWVAYAQGLPVVRHDDGIAPTLQARQRSAVSWSWPTRSIRRRADRWFEVSARTIPSSRSWW
ncbi:MAG: hypothetical protein R2706_10705 [Acidimicrobiales bacterium]